MKRVLIALAMIAASMFFAAPAIGQEDATGSTEPGTSNEGTAAETTPPPAEDPPVPEETPESPATPEAPETPEAAPEADANAPAAEDDVQLLAVVDQVTICHARNAESNPYGPQAVTVSVQSIVNPNGHATHTGPVFPAADWGDIIPPFDYEGGSFPGLNWNGAGQEIYFNDCQPEDGEPGENNVTICHATGSQNMPYNRPSPSVDGILNGHADHTGGVFPEDPWGDIIPPFDFGPGEQFDGLNWTTEGQAIYFNNCEPSDVPDDDDDDDGDGDGDGDDEGEALPNTGGDSPWILLTGGLLVVLGIAMLNSSPTMSGMHVATRGRHVKI